MPTLQIDGAPIADIDDILAAKLLEAAKRKTGNVFSPVGRPKAEFPAQVMGMQPTSQKQIETFSMEIEFS